MKKVIVILFGVSTLLTGCFTSRSFVNFEVLQPALISYPETVQKVGYLNRAPVNKNSFSREYHASLDQSSLFLIDTMICNKLLDGYMDAIEDADLPYLKYILNMEARRRDTLGKSEPLSEEYRQAIFENQNLDALIVLEYYTLSMTKSRISYDFYIGDYTQEYMLAAEVLWRIYVRGSDKILNEYTNPDTLYFLNTARSQDSVNWTPVTVIQSGFYDIGYKYGERHIPVWSQVARIIFRNGNSELVNAARLTDEGDWEGAFTLWTEQSGSDDPKIAARAMNNLAVYYELEDDIDNALYYAQSAMELWENETIEDFVQELQIRAKNREDILKQYRQ